MIDESKRSNRLRPLKWGLVIVVLAVLGSLVILRSGLSPLGPPASTVANPGHRAPEMVAAPKLPINQGGRVARTALPGVLLDGAVRVRVTDPRLASVGGAVLLEVPRVELSKRVVRGTPCGVTDVSGVVTLPQPSSWPLHLAVRADGFVPGILSCDAPGDYVVHLQSGCRLIVDVRNAEGGSIPDCPLLLSRSPLGPFREMMDLAADWSDNTVPVNPNTGILRAITNAHGVAIFEAVPEGEVKVLPARLGTSSVRSEPRRIVVPEVLRAQIVIEEVYVVALKTPGDEVVDVGQYNTEKAVISFGPAMEEVVREARKLMGPGVCFALEKKPTVSDADFLSWDIRGTMVLRKRGRMPFVARPMKLADVGNAPTLDLAGVEEQVAGQAVLLPDASLRDVEGALDSARIVLWGQSPGAGLAVHLSRQPVEIPPGTYSCKAMGALRGLVVVAPTIQVFPGQLSQVPVRLIKPVVPMRLKVINEHGIEHRVGLLTIRAVCEYEVVVSAMKLNGIHWLPPGRLEVIIQLDMTRPAFKCELNLPIGATSTPIELRVVIP